MTHPIERFARFLGVSRRHLLDGVMPSRRVPRRAQCDDEAADDAWVLLPVATVSTSSTVARVSGFAPPVLQAAAAPGRAAPRRMRRAVRPQPSNENRPSATSFASG